MELPNPMHCTHQVQTYAMEADSKDYWAAPSSIDIHNRRWNRSGLPGDIQHWHFQEGDLPPFRQLGKSVQKALGITYAPKKDTEVPGMIMKVRGKKGEKSTQVPRVVQGYVSGPGKGQGAIPLGARLVCARDEYRPNR